MSTPEKAIMNVDVKPSPEIKGKTETATQRTRGDSDAAKALTQLCVNTIRTLAMDAVQKANSGHPGTPMALAPVAYVLWDEVLRYDPEQPLWPARDRFVLS